MSLRLEGSGVHFLLTGYTAVTDDLKIAAYAQGGDAITDLSFEKINGLAANCWYVLEGSATILQIENEHD